MRCADASTAQAKLCVANDGGLGVRPTAILLIVRKCPAVSCFCLASRQSTTEAALTQRHKGAVRVLGNCPVVKHSLPEFRYFHFGCSNFYATIARNYNPRRYTSRYKIINEPVLRATLPRALSRAGCCLSFGSVLKFFPRGLATCKFLPTNTDCRGATKRHRVVRPQLSCFVRRARIAASAVPSVAAYPG